MNQWQRLKIKGWLNIQHLSNVTQKIVLKYYLMYLKVDAWCMNHGEHSSVTHLPTM